jgi:thioredoxin reductase
MILKKKYDVIIIGSGPGGVAAGIAAKQAGAEDVLILERDVEPGGILLQCIHNGFGMENFGEDLPGPTYAQKYIEDAFKLGVEFMMETMVLDITPQRKLFATNKKQGVIELEGRSIVLGNGLSRTYSCPDPTTWCAAIWCVIQPAPHSVG